MAYEPTICVIIPVAPGGDISKVVESVRMMDYPMEKLEIIVVEGKNPSHQRNEAAKSSESKILYFLDNDAMADKRLFRYVMAVFEEEEDVSVVGGPSMTPATDTIMQKCFGYVLASIFGAYIAREKFLPLGLIRNATEKELILCNMAMMKELFEESGGFNTSLFPNEENEFLNRLNSRRFRIMYHPLAVVYKSQRANFFLFSKQLFNYGRGRAEHFFVRPDFAEPAFGIPSAFVLYLVSLLFYHKNPYYLAPLGVYLLIVLFASVSIVLAARNPRTLFFTLLAFPVLHISYGIGFLFGAMRMILRLKSKTDLNIKITKIKQLAEKTISEPGG